MTALRIAIVTDAWFPQVNGVVRTLATVRGELEAMGHTVEIVAPDRFRTIPTPTYPEIRLALLPGRKVRRLLDEFGPDAIHIATEGPLGWAARRHCLRRKLPFTTSFHTKFPDYIHARFRLPVRWGYALMRRFHAPSRGVMVATTSLGETLKSYGIGNIRRWTRGVDTILFRPRPKSCFPGPRPVFLFTGRVAVEKNIEAFLALDLPGQKVVVGDGPLLPALRSRHPGVVFTGYKRGEELAEHMASADVFVFPSETDTAGNVVLEAQASGLPVVVSNVGGPKENMCPGLTGLVCAAPGAVVWADQMAPILRSADLRMEMAERARQYAVSRRWDLALGPLFDAYRELGGGSHTRAA